MKMDKDTIIKHRFWVGLGLFVVLWLVTVVLVKVSAAGAASKKRGEFEKATASLDSAKKKSPKNASFLPAWVSYEEFYNKQKEGVWKEAWEIQKSIPTWPSDGVAPLSSKLFYPDDPVEYSERNEYMNRLWAQQIEEFYKKFTQDNPVEILNGRAGYDALMLPVFGGTPGGGTGAVGGEGAGLKLRMPGVAGSAGMPGMPGMPSGGGGDGAFWKKAPTPEEMWLAQEDFWVKRELLEAVRSAVESAGRLEEVLGVKDPLPKGAPEGSVLRRYHNDQWQLDLVLEPAPRRRRALSKLSTIKNINGAQRTLALAGSGNTAGLTFRIRVGDDQPWEFRVEGEPLAYGQSRTFLSQSQEVQRLNLDDPKRQFVVEQKFDSANSPVRRIDEIKLGRHSHRTAGVTLKPGPFSPKETADASTQQQAAPAPNVPAMTPGMPGMPGAPGGTAAASGTMTTNLIERNRYLFVSDECRHMPVALLVVVDQGHIQDVLAALSNSRLRVQVTQCQYRHVGGIRSQGTPAGGGLARGPGGRDGPEDRGGPTLPGAPGPGSTNVADEEDPNLVELAVYGIAALYERYPPKPKGPKDAAPGGVPTTPTSSGAPTPGDSKPGTPAPKPADGKPADGKPADGKPADGKPADGKAPDAKTPDSKAPDAKAPDAATPGRAPENKPGDGKAGDGKASPPK